MPALNIDGHSVNVDDSFLKLSPEDQNKTVDEIHQSLAPKADISANNVVRSAAEGVPIVGGMLNKANAATNAALAPVLNPLFAEKDQLPEPSFGERYAHSLRDQVGMSKGFEAAHPVVDTAAKLAGGVASLGGVAAAVPGAARVLGMSGPTLTGMVGRGAVSGAALGGADAAVRGEGAVHGAEEGAAFGAAGPVVGRAIGKVAGAVMNKIRPEPVVPQRTVSVGKTDIPISEAEATGSPIAGAEEQIIARGGRGDPAQATAQSFLDERSAKLGQVHDEISAGLDPSGQSPRTAPQDAGQRVSAELSNQETARKAAQAAEEARVAAQGEAVRGGPGAPTPFDAAETVGQGVADRASAARAQTKSLYDRVKATPGEFDPSVPKGLAEDIRSRLNKGDDPLWVDPQTSSKANEALKLIDQTVGNGLFKNAAAPVGPVAEAVAKAGTPDWHVRAQKLADEMIAQGINPARARAAAASSEGGPMAPHSVAVPGGGSVDVVPKVVEASHIRTSADQGYDPALQPRNRARAASDAQVNDIANNLNPNRLGVSSEADRGAPIIGPDGMVESGNGRVLGIRKAYQQGGESASKYREWLSQQGVDVSKFKEPVLVRERATPMDAEQRKAFTVGSNQSSTLSMSAPEKALADARLLSPESLSLIHNPADLGSVENRHFVRYLVSKLPQAEQGAMMTPAGDLSSEGLARVRNAVLGKAYGDTPILSRIAESTNDEIKGISNALTASAPEWAALRAAVAAGRVPANLDVTKDLLDAVQRTAALRAKGVGLVASRAQIDAFSKPSAESDLIQRMFYGADGKTAAPAGQVANALRNYAQDAAKVDASPGLGLGLAPVTARDILETTAAKVGAPKVLAKEVTEKSAAKLAKTAETVAVEASPSVGLKEMDSARKRLVVMYGDAKKAAMGPGGSGSDVRAMGRILHEFDNSIIDAFEGGKFSGDSATARQLLTDARASHAEYRNTFTNRGGSDPVGRSVEKILGHYTDSAATPDQIATLSYGPAAAPGGGQAIQVAQRLKSILGETSPEWGAYKKGLIAHVEGEGTAAKRADRIENFLRGTKGKGLANLVLDRAERQGLGDYAQSLRGLEPKPMNSVDKAIARLSGADGNPPAAGHEIVNMVMGTDGSGGNVKVIQALKQKLSPESWTSLRQGVWQKLTTRGEDMIPFEAQALHTRLSRFLNDQGREAGQVLFSKEERALMKQLASVYKQMIPVKGTTNPSGTAPMLAKIAKGAQHQLLPLLGFGHGGIPGAMVGVAAGKALTAMGNARNVTKATNLFYGQQAKRPISPVPGSLATLLAHGMQTDHRRSQ